MPLFYILHSKTCISKTCIDLFVLCSWSYLMSMFISVPRCASSYHHQKQNFKLNVIWSEGAHANLQNIILDMLIIISFQRNSFHLWIVITPFSIKGCCFWLHVVAIWYIFVQRYERKIEGLDISLLPFDFIFILLIWYPSYLVKIYPYIEKW